MENLLIHAVFGHLIGDFFLQNKDMANSKYRPGLKGLLWCSTHVLVYTLTVGLFVGNFSPLFLLGVYIPHWIVDRWSLAYHWMRVIGRGDLLKSDNPQEASFGGIIYVTIDQTIHLGCLYALLTLI